MRAFSPVATLCLEASKCYSLKLLHGPSQLFSILGDAVKLNGYIKLFIFSSIAPAVKTKLDIQHDYPPFYSFLHFLTYFVIYILFIISTSSHISSEKKTYRSTGVRPSRDMPLWSTIRAASYRPIRAFWSSSSLPTIRR